MKVDRNTILELLLYKGQFLEALCMDLSKQKEKIENFFFGKTHRIYTFEHILDNTTK